MHGFNDLGWAQKVANLPETTKFNFGLPQFHHIFSFSYSICCHKELMTLSALIYFLNILHKFKIQVNNLSTQTKLLELLVQQFITTVCFVVICYPFCCYVSHFFIFKYLKVLLHLYFFLKKKNTIFIFIYDCIIYI